MKFAPRSNASFLATKLRSYDASHTSSTSRSMVLENLVIHNPGSGNAQAARFLENLLDPRTTHLEQLDANTNLIPVVKNAAHAGCKLVVAAGGDGTVNAVVNAMMHLQRTERPRLAILPLGTANDFAGTLMLPDDISTASVLLSESNAYVPMDIVEVQAKNLNRYFANVAAGGNSVRVTEEMTNELKERWGAFCYLRGAMNVLGDLDSFRITAEFDQETIENIDTWAVIVANGKTNAGRIPVAPHAVPNDGLLDVILIQNGTVADIVEIVSGAIFGNYLECEQVIFRQCRALTLHSLPAMRFTMDGEVVDEEPVQFKVQPGAIDMLVGPNFVLPSSTPLQLPKRSGRPIELP